MSNETSCMMNNETNRLEPKGGLTRGLSLFQVYAIAAGAIFTGIGYLDGVFYGFCGQGTWLGFLLMTIAILPVVSSYCELVPLFPQAGGDLIYNTVGLNKHFGFLSAWFILACWLATPIACVMAITEWVNMVMGFSVGLYPQLILYVVILAVFCILSLNKIELAGKVQSIMFIIAVGFCLLSTVLLFFSGHWSITNIHQIFRSGLPDTIGLPGWAIGCSMLIMPFFGFETVPQMLEEAKFPISKSVKAIWGSVITCGVIYSLLFLAISGTGGYEELLASTPDGYFLTINWITKAMGWRAYALIFGLGSVFCACATSLLGFWLACARLIYSMGSQNFLPNAFCKLNKKQQPILPNLFILGVSLFFVATIAVGSSIIDFINLMSFGCSVTYALTMLSAIRIKYKYPSWQSTYKLPGGMFMRVLAVIIAFAISFFCTLGQSVNSWLCFGGYMLIGFAIWLTMALGKWKQQPVTILTPDGEKQF